MADLRGQDDVTSGYEGMSPAGRAAAMRYAKRKACPSTGFDMSDFRAEGEDDDGYDPYSDYMDATARSMHEDPCEDPWR